ncbi:dTDP-4-dehydrorhamnose reductase [Chromohalobacter israelensis]|uniref:dTDP-4-dehydrorhamnose reductase n=1 Tax=Chromohalobacter israelensis TaxID=141390 RepID=UPI000D714133|nr:dTDP-4-dehydrorhamnose reductase [Chromohalobacter salexigens]PWW38177.1 dTDP-4-dehydrorhamnose reductase [Chromohalobacter salexigens]
MRILITGARGQVGHELIKLAPDEFTVVGLGSDELDVTSAERVREVVFNHSPDLIINAAAYTAVDKAESEPGLAYAVNRGGVANLGSVAEHMGIPLFHISTDYVFSGEGTKPYSEKDATCPTGVYGSSKLAGERALMETSARYMILRTSWVFGSHGNNFVKTMLRLGQERKELLIVDDQIGSPTSASGIARALWYLATEYKKTGSLHWGLYHIGGTPACSWCDFAKEIFQQAQEIGLLERKPAIKAITTKEFPTPAKRPLWSVLDSRLLYEKQGVCYVDWRADLRCMLLELSR